MGLQSLQWMGLLRAPVPSPFSPYEKPYVHVINLPLSAWTPRYGSGWSHPGLPAFLIFFAQPTVALLNPAHWLHCISGLICLRKTSRIFQARVVPSPMPLWYHVHTFTLLSTYLICWNSYSCWGWPITGVPQMFAEMNWSYNKFHWKI